MTKGKERALVQRKRVRLAFFFFFSPGSTLTKKQKDAVGFVGFSQLVSQKDLLCLLSEPRTLFNFICLLFSHLMQLKK